MNCTIARETIGPYLDGELMPETRTELEAHLQACPMCAAELQAQRDLFAELDRCRPATEAHPPAELWAAIADCLDAPQPTRHAARFIRLWRRPLAAAASLALLIGMGVFAAVWLNSSATPALAEVVDYDLLLENLAGDVDAAVDRFLTYYKAEPVSVEAAGGFAPKLSFALPRELPGGYRLIQAYRLQFGKSPGIAARYRSDTDPLVVFFHPPMGKTPMGVHRDSPCAVACQHAHRVEVGPWHLVHFTDPTTCHCVLSKLDMDAELPAVLAAVAPSFAEGEKGRER